MTGLLAHHPLHNLPAHLNIVVGVIPFTERKSHVEVSLNVLVPTAVGFGLDHEAFTISLDLDGVGLRIAEGEHRGDHLIVHAPR